MKILWAPIVDSVYIKAFGRRKTWLVPAQVLIGVFMIFLSKNVDEWLGDGEKKPQMFLLTSSFFMLYFLTATQDIAVDGWALSMLKRKNVGHAATCNAVGQTAGYFTGYVLFLVMESKEFSNKYVFSEVQTRGLITLSGFLFFWGIVFIVTTVLIALFKRENSENDKELENNPDYGITNAYPMIWKIIKMKPVLRFGLILVTVPVSFAAVDAISVLKLIDYGIPKDKIALLAVPIAPVQIILPFIISRFTTGPFPMNVHLKAFPVRILLSIVIAIFVFATPTMLKNSKEIPLHYYALIVTIYMLYQVPFRAMFVGEILCFFSQKEDNNLMNL